jgi:citrate/tricarballylate utilization protein
MTRRLAFPQADIHYLANLCHNCGACLHACQYAPPHEFAVNLPRAMAAVRADTYARYAWPAPFARLYQRNGLAVAMALALGLAVFLALAVGWNRPLWGHPGAGSFYAIFPHGLMVSLFAPVFLFATLALGVGLVRFWREVSPGAPTLAPLSAAVAEAAHDAATLKYLDGGHGEGCHEEDDAWTHARRRFHHFTFYGFMLCFAATSVATVYHYGFGWVAPYGWTSIPKLLGTVGGIGLVVGPAGLFWLHAKRHPQHGDPSKTPMERAFLGMLLLVGASGLGLAVFKGTAALPLLLCLHLGAVLGFFAMMPYSKFAHGFYRLAALLKYAIEKRQRLSLKLSGD